MSDLSSEPGALPLSPADPFNSLPNELLSNIISLSVPFLDPNRPLSLAHHGRRIAFLQSIHARQTYRLVSKRWNAVIGRETECFVRTSFKVKLLAITLEREAKETRAREVKSLIVKEVPPWSGWRVAVDRLLRACPELESLSLLLDKEDGGLDMVGVVSLSKLRRFECSDIRYNYLEPCVCPFRSATTSTILTPLFVSRLLTSQTTLEDLRLDAVTAIPSTLPPLAVRLRRLHLPLAYKPEPTASLLLLQHIVQSSRDTLIHLHISTPFMSPSTELSLFSSISLVAPNLRSFAFVLAVHDGSPPSLIDSLVPLMPDLEFLQPGDYGYSFSSLSFLCTHFRLRQLLLTWDCKRARDQHDWSWDEFVGRLMEREREGRTDVLVIEVLVHGVLRDYDTAQRMAKNVLAGSRLKKVTVWLKYWEEPFRAYP
jgi:hypothetical protein